MPDSASGPSTLGLRLLDARRRLADAGVPANEAELDARLLAQRALGWDAAHLLRELRAPVPPGFDAAYRPWLERRLTREPMAYVLGQQEFWGLTFEVSPAVLIPRPETETIVEAVIARRRDRADVRAIADVCTGSGCLATVLATEYPAAHVVATDISGAALKVARRNVARHNANDRVQLIASDLLEVVDGSFDVIVANPPYVPETEHSILPPEVRDYEPRVALFAGHDGLEVIERLVPQASNRLGGGGLLVFEFGFGQDRSVAALVASVRRLELRELKADLQGIPRVAIAERVR
jgi:release factor glutamine methyltransferase